VLRQGLLTAGAECAAVVIGKIGGDNAVTEAGEAVELGRNDLPPITSRDQDGWTGLTSSAYPRHRRVKAAVPRLCHSREDEATMHFAVLIYDEPDSAVLRDQYRLK
jgi:hypothetical protein